MSVNRKNPVFGNLPTLNKTNHMNYVSEQKKKVIRMTPLNSEQVALSQPRISEFLSDNANKDSIRPTAPSSPDVEKTSNLSPQVENVPLLKESVSEAEGTAKVA